MANNDDSEKLDREQLQANTKAIADIMTTNAVVARDIGYMRGEIETISKKLDELSKKFVTHEEVASITKRVENLESVRDWIERIIIGAVLIGLLALLGLKG